MAQGNLVEAADHYEAALKINPNHAYVHSNYGNHIKAHGKLVEAADHCALGSVPRRSRVAPISLMKCSTAATELTCWAGAVVAALGRTPP